MSRAKANKPRVDTLASKKEMYRLGAVEIAIIGLPPVTGVLEVPVDEAGHVPLDEVAIQLHEMVHELVTRLKSGWKGE